MDTHQETNTLQAQKEKSIDGRRVGTAIHRCMTRTRTETYLLSAKNRFEQKVTATVEPAESQFTKYAKKSKKSSKPSTSLSRVSQMQSKHMVSTVRVETIDYATKDTVAKPTVKVEYASALGPAESQKILISKWVDYSSKYGIGYKLSNG